MPNPKNYVGSQAICEYEADLAGGISRALVTRHAEHRVNALRKIDSFAANTAADQIERWLNALANG